MSEPDINNTTKIRTLNAGNGLAAICDLAPGSLILKISEPYLMLLEKAQLQSTCSWCFSKPENSTTLKTCTGCKSCRYCSVECQKNDWRAIHKKECKILKGLPDVPPTPTRGLMQLSLRHRYGNNPDPKWEGLVMNDGFLSRDQTRCDELGLQAIAAANYTGRGKEWMQMGFKVLCQMSTNAFRVTLPDDTPIGICFESKMALANHSCSPNAVVVFDGRAVSIRALNKIKQGEEIFVSYIDFTSTRDKRRKELHYRYFFECICEKCTNDENAYQTYLRLQGQGQDQSHRRINVLCNPTSTNFTAQNSLAKYAQEARIPHMLQSISEAQSQLDEYSKNATNLPPESQLHFLQNLCVGPSFGYHAIAPYPAGLHELYLTFLDLESWIPALICLLSLVLHSDPYIYPSPHHPVRVIRLFTIAKLLAHVGGLTSDELPQAVVGLSRDITQAIREPLQELAISASIQLLMGIVAEEARNSFGDRSRFVDGLAKHFPRPRESSGIGARDKEDADRSAMLERWMVDGEDEVGRKEAENIARGLKKLADCVEWIVGMPL